jgi:RND family efflux transporter MFP subunit
MKQSFVLLSICAGLFLSACSSNKNDIITLEKFPVTHPVVTDTVYINEYVADIHSRQNVEIRARIKGYIEKIYVDEGSSVRQGQLLFSISNKGFHQDLLRARASLSSAVAEAKSAEVNLENTKIIVEKKVVAKSELDIAQSKLDAANAKIKEAESDEANALLDLSFTEIKAPFDGIINRIPNKTGSLIDEGTLLTSISDNKEVLVYFKVSEREYLDLILKKNTNKDTKVELLLANHQLYNHKGVIETVEGEFDKTTGNIAFRARFPNPDLILKHGSSGKIRLKKELKNAMIIPQKSTFEVQEKTLVYVLDSNNVVQMRSIVPRLRLPNFYVIESGLSLNDRIVYEGLQRVKEGDKIIPVLYSEK